MIDAHIIEDSLNPARVRITTFVCKYPRFIHSEVMTHRMISKNSASSRAIPIKKVIQEVIDNPACPEEWGKNQSGMQAKELLDSKTALQALNVWREARMEAITQASRLESLGVHKQIVNRLLEPWAHMTVVMTATDWENFFALRVHTDAQPEFQRLAHKMLKAYLASDPKQLQVGEWHLPFQYHCPEGTDTDTLLKVCTGRCARTSYKNQDGNYSLEDDVKLHDRLVAQHPGHWTPAEHCARARFDDGIYCPDTRTYSNVRGFTQYRKTFPGRENITGIDLRELYEASANPNASAYSGPIQDERP